MGELIGNFFGYHATAAERLPEKLSERQRREFFSGSGARMCMVEKRSEPYRKLRLPGAPYFTRPYRWILVRRVFRSIPSR